ncbi:TonB-dependent receptor [Hyphomicrobium sp. CS1GBMeth3]|uniref:TonB-dependent receptor n=1 Tax=Hyphomicrobium sp. CS1GBMeth3 TaxID=1892845 RepID=UPI000931C3FE|nr:TonB-dependent receptor [Hyphomicrobium sp. CS1GBMeth3]
MSLRSPLFLTVAAAALIAVIGSSEARAQEAGEAAAATELPAIEVTTTHSPVRKSARRAARPQAAPAAPAAQSTSIEEEPLPDLEVPPGTLIVSEDAFVATTVATEREILATSGQTITDSLQTKPGIIGSTFAPGANRPIIRGLDSYRVRTQENGIGTHDVAAISEDHAVPVDPNSADQIEVVRGPATLRYGSQAIGGVVSVENQRIPTYIPKGGFSGTIRGAGTSVDEGKDGSFKATAGSNGFAVHADGFWRDADDYDSPRGTVVNSFVESKGGSLGASIIGSDGFFGVSYSRIESTYGIPGEEAEEGVDPYIGLVQDRIMAKGEWRVRDSGIDAIRFWFGASDYRHNEWAKHDHGHDDDDDHDHEHEVDFEVHSRFKNKEQEARIEVQHVPVATSFGPASGALGVHLVNRKTSGIVPDPDAGESLLEPAHTQSIAAFWFEELELNPFLRLQAAARIEHTTVDGTGWEELHGEVHGDHGHFHPHTFEGERSFTPVSGSLGLLHKLPFDTVARLMGSYVERAPDAAELFSKGMHEATGTFEVGNPFLDVEKATTAEVGLKKANGAFRFDASAYYTRYNGFIYRALQGLECDPVSHGGEFNCVEAGHDDDDDGHDHDHTHMFDLVYFQQRDANFYGVELAFQYDVAPIWRGLWGIDGQYDFVHAKFDGGGYVPRIPPHRLGGGIYYRDPNWFARAGVLHAFDQDQFGEEEIATPGYTLVSAELSYTFQAETINGVAPVATIGLKGENLADDEVLNHASFKRREDVLLPGASVRLFGSISLN